MSRIAETFRELSELEEGCLACYLMGGDPEPEFSREAILAIAEAGADIVEVGIPFSDPVGDGPTIQAAGARALATGATPDGILGVVSQVRRKSEVPIVIMTYYNIALRAGLDEFARKVARSGADGVILADLPVQEAAPWIEEARAASLDTIFLVSPTTGERALEEIGAVASGFVYCVSLMGVTGARASLASGVENVVRRTKGRSPLPVLIGFGISTPQQVRRACQIADGAVVGSALIDLASSHYCDRGMALKELSEFVANLKKATSGAAPGAPRTTGAPASLGSSTGRGDPAQRRSGAPPKSARGGR